MLIGILFYAPIELPHPPLYHLLQTCIDVTGKMAMMFIYATCYVNIYNHVKHTPTSTDVGDKMATAS